MFLNQTMIVAIFRAAEGLFALENRALPAVGEGEVLLKVAAFGISRHDITLTSNHSLTCGRAFGHEISGYAIEGKGNGFAIDQLYSVLPGPPVALTSKEAPEYYYAEYVAVPAERLVAVPTKVSAAQAAYAAGPGSTIYNAVQNFSDTSLEEQKVLVVGAGAYGLQMVQLASHFGASVTVAERRPEARELALKYGAAEAFDFEETIVKRSTTEYHVRSAHCGALEATELSKRHMATAVDAMTLGSARPKDSECAHKAAQFTDKAHLAAILSLYAMGIAAPVIDTFELSDINTIVSGILGGKIYGRAIVIL